MTGVNKERIQAALPEAEEAYRTPAGGISRDEAVSLRGFYLRLASRWYLLPLALLLGALIGGGAYYCRHVLFAPAREYAAGARLYLEFSPDAAGNARDYYNAWTWKELITSDEILDSAMGELIGRGYADEAERSGSAVLQDHSTVKKEDDELVLVAGENADGMLTRAEVLSAVTIRMPSDLRVMMLTSTHHERDKADAILSAMTASLAAFGESNENFREIRVLESTPALLVVTTDYTKNAVILGAVLAGLLCIALLFLFYASDDAVYDPEMPGRRYGLPVLGVLGREGRGAVADVADSFERELRVTCGKRFAELAAHRAGNGSCRTAVLAAEGRDAQAGARICQELTRVLGKNFGDGACAFIPLKGTEGLSEAAYDCCIVGIPYGIRGSAYADHLISVLSLQGIPVAGLILYDADLRYLKRLYRL